MSEVDNTDLFNTVQLVISKVDKLTGATLLAIHNGKDSGQEIPHVHVHLIPRQSSDQAGPVHSMFKDRPKLSDEEIAKRKAKTHDLLEKAGAHYVIDSIADIEPVVEDVNHV